MRTPTVRPAALAVAATLLLGAAISAAGAATYNSADLLVVLYQPHGREFIADIGPASNYTGAALPVAVIQYSASDLAGVFGGALPASLQAAVLGANGADGYFASNGPGSASLVGSAIGASNQIRFLGNNMAFNGTPVSGNASAATFDFGDPRSYQATLNAQVPGTIGNNVSFDTESSFAGATIDVPFFSARFNPFAGVAATQAQVGTFRFEPDGTALYLPLRRIQATCAAGPSTLNPKSQGNTFSFGVALTDVTDPAVPVAVPLSRMSPAYISQVGETVLPVPFSGPGCTSDQDGIWETTALRVGPYVYFTAASDGDCSTLDGNRQDILAVVGRSTGVIPICFAGDVDGNPVSCCAQVNVLDKARR